MDRRRQNARVLGGAILAVTLGCVLAWVGKIPRGPTRPPSADLRTPSGQFNHAPNITRSRPSKKHPGKPRNSPTVQVRAVRLADILREAKYTGPDPIRSYRRLQRHWLKMLDPYSALDPLRAHMRLKVAFLEPRARMFLRDDANALRRSVRVKTRNWHWARRGVYDSRLALFAPFPDRRTKRGPLPQGASYVFNVGLPQNPVLEFGIGVIARKPGFVPRPRFAVEVESDGQIHRVWETRVQRLKFTGWIQHRVPLTRFSGRAVRIHLKTWGADAAGLWADPQIWGDGTAEGDNVLFIVVDCMRPDAVRALGGKHAMTPNMDNLVRRSTRMTRFFANGSWTRASMVSFFSGNYPSAVGLGTHSFSLPRRARLRFYSVKPPQLPLHLEKHGYVTAAVMNNYFALPFAPTGLDHGFPELTDVRDPFLDNEVINQTAVRFLEKNRNRRFFLYVHYETVHNYPRRPNIRRRMPLPRSTRMNARFREYLAQARIADRYVGRLLSALTRLGLHRRTLVILTADHGEVFDRRHDHFVFHYVMRMRYQHARSVWDEVTHIPMVWSRPGRIREGVELRTQLRAVDLAPSVTDYLRLPAMKGTAGHSFWPLLDTAAEKSGRNETDDPPVYTEGFRIRGLRAFGHKYIFREQPARTYVYKGRLYHAKERLFDLKADPGETMDLSRKKPELLARMRKLMKDIRSNTRPPALSDRESKSWPVYHLRFCGDGRPVRLTGRVRLLDGEGRVVVTGAQGRMRLSPLDPANRQLALAVDAATVCSGLDWTSPPNATLRLELYLNDRPIGPSEIRVGAFGLSLLRRTVLDLTTAPLLAARRPPELVPGRDTGIFLWQDHVVGSVWFDSAAANRDQASQELVRFNLIQGGYIKKSNRKKKR